MKFIADRHVIDKIPNDFAIMPKMSDSGLGITNLFLFFLNLGDNEYGELNGGECKQMVACLI